MRVLRSQAGKRLLSVTWALLIAWILVVLLFTFVQRKMMYFPATARSLSVELFGELRETYPSTEDVAFASSDGNTIHGWWLHHSADSGHNRPLVLMFHGNAGNRAGRISWYSILGQAGCEVLAIDYQGYGDSEGKPSQAAIEADAEATWQYAVNHLEYSPSRIIVMGVSLGGAAAVHLSATQSELGHAPAGLIAVSTFSAMVDVAASHYPWLPVRAVLVDCYQSDEKIPKVTSPYLQFHGDCDTVVEARFGRLLFECAPQLSACGTAKRWVDLPECGHSDMLYRCRPLIHQEITQFVASIAANLSRG